MTKVVTKVAYGRKELEFRVPSKLFVGEYRPKSVQALQCLSSAVTNLLSFPTKGSPLGDIVKSRDKIVIVIDDITRPTPSKNILKPLIKYLGAMGVRDSQIVIVTANGSHRMHTLDEKRCLVGDEIFSRIKVIDHDSTGENCISLGVTSRNTPVEVNRIVAEADARILVGMIKPHNSAGYSGGGKSILPGVCSIRTIIHDHSYNATANPRSISGVLNGNPIRSDIEEAAAMVGPSFIVNVILNDNKYISGIVTGDMVDAHREGVKMLDSFVKVAVPQQVDIAIVGCSYPASICFYQAVNAVAQVVRIPTPIVRERGVVILSADCPEGVGHKEFYRLLKESSSPSDVLDRLALPGVFLKDQWAAQIWSSILQQVEVVLISEGITPEMARVLKVRLAYSPDDAMNIARETCGVSNPTMASFPDAPYTLPYLSST